MQNLAQTNTTVFKLDYVANEFDPDRGSVAHAVPQYGHIPISRFRASQQQVPQEATQAEVMPPALTANWQLLVHAEFSEETFGRLYIIASLEKDWNGSESLPLSAESLGHFLRFWLSVQDIAKEPELTLTPRGHIQVEWYKNKRRLLEIEFSEDRNVFYALLDGDSVNEGKEDPKELAEMMQRRASKPLRWNP